MKILKLTSAINDILNSLQINILDFFVAAYSETDETDSLIYNISIEGQSFGLQILNIDSFEIWNDNEVLHSKTNKTTFKNAIKELFNHKFIPTD